MGQPSGLQERLFYEFRLEDWVPSDHLLRKIDAVLDLSSLRHALAPFYSHTGRPSVDPELMLRMLLVGYCYGLRSERRLCDETHLNLAYRWFCRLGLEGVVPDHSTFSKNRHGRFRESALFRRLFEEVVARCMRAGLVGGEGFAIDASVIEADASCGRKIDGKLSTWPETEKLTRPVREYLAALERAVDDSQHLGGRGLLLQGLARLGQQPHILHCNHCLRREVFEQCDLLFGKRLDAPSR